MLLSNPKTETSHYVEFIVFKDNDDCQPILGLQTSEQMHLVKIQDTNFHSVAASKMVVVSIHCVMTSWENFQVCNTTQSIPKCAPRSWLSDGYP